MKLITIQICFSIHFWSISEIFIDVFQIIFSWWRITTKKLTNLTFLSKPWAWSLRSISYIFKISTQRNSQKGTIVWILILLDLLPDLLFLFTTVPFFSVSHYFMIELSRFSVEMISKQRWLFIFFTLSSLSNLFPSNFRIQKVQHWVKRSGRSQRSLAKDEGERIMNIKCVGKRYGCPKAS